MNESINRIYQDSLSTINDSYIFGLALVGLSAITAGVVYGGCKLGKTVRRKVTDWSINRAGFKAGRQAREA